MTIFRDGCARSGVLITDSPKKEKEGKKNRTERAKSQLNFGDTILVDDSVIGIKRKLKTGCGSLHCTFYFCPETGELREVFLDKGSSGGCLSLLNAMSRLSSLAARKGAPVEEIADQLQSVLVCPSYSVAKAKAKDISKGSSCASAVANALLDAHKQFVEEFLEIDEDEEIEIKTVQKESKKTNSNPYMKCPECGEHSMIQIESGQWHSLEVLESGTVIFEAKDGRYMPLSAEEIKAKNK
jgi:ribonucleoside-diphosphate reductase alpha chain